MKRIIAALCFLALASCGSESGEQAPNPTNCSVEQVAEGVEWTCTDHNGEVSQGTVRHGEQGPVGPAGPSGPGLSVAKSVQCGGEVEGWMQGTSYRIELRVSEFETGDSFVSSTTKLVRDGEVINMRGASSFMLSGMPLLVTDGLFTMLYADDSLRVTSEGGVDVTLECEVL